MPTEIDYQLERIQIGLEAGQADALEKWQTTFEESRHHWNHDRARRLLQIIKSDSINEGILRIVRYYEATLFVNLGEWSKARKAFEHSIALCKEFGDPKGEVRAINGLANLLRRSADHLDRAVETFDTVEQSDFLDAASKTILLNGKGLLLYEKGDLVQAHSCFNEVLALATQNKDQALLASAYHNLGSIAWTRGKLQEATGFLEKARDLQHLSQDSHGEAETLNSLGLVQEALGHWEKAIETYKLALEMLEKSGDFYGQSQVLVNLGNVYSLQHEVARALSCLEQAYEIAKELGNPRLQGQSLTALGDLYRSNQELGKAAEVLHQAIKVKLDSGELRSLKHNWLSLGAVYHQLKQPQDAQSAYEKTLAITREQDDRRMTAVTLLNQSLLLTAQEKFSEALSALVEAKVLATEGEYQDCLAWIYEQEGDLELLSQEPNSARILEAYFLALWHACQFNSYELQKLIQRLQKFWLANAEDGEVNASLWFCDSIIQLWHNTDGTDLCHTVVDEFAQLRAKILSKSAN